MIEVVGITKIQQLKDEIMTSIVNTAVINVDRHDRASERIAKSYGLANKHMKVTMSFMRNGNQIATIIMKNDVVDFWKRTGYFDIGWVKCSKSTN